MWNELKKVLIIAALTLVAAALSFFPVFAPIGLVMSAWLLAVQFVDYSWARHQWRVGQCLKDSVSHVFSYSLSGVFFMLLMALPGINLLAIPIAVIYFTLLWAEKNQQKLAHAR